MKRTKYHNQITKYLILHDTAKSAYEIANFFNNLNNDSAYNKALIEMVDYGDVLRNDRGEYLLNKPKFDPIVSSPNFRGIYKSNEAIFDLIISNKKMTFREWLIATKDLQQAMTELHMFELTKLSEEKKQ